MRVLPHTPSRRPRSVSFIVITLGMLALTNLALLHPGSPFPIRLAGGIVLFCLLPGLTILPLLVPQRDSLDTLESIVVCAGLSYAVSVLITYAVYLLPGEMTLERMLLCFDALIALAAVVSYSRGSTSGCFRDRLPLNRGFLIQIGLLLILAAALRFTFLGYAEFQGDEIEVVSGGIDAIAGQDDALFSQQKGPTQFLLAAAFALFTDGASEFAIRSPFALASVLTVLAVVVMGRRVLNERVGLIAGALLLLEGVASAHARTVQYQYVVILMITTSVYCAQRFLDARDDNEGGSYFGLAVFFWAVGLLTHYDAILILPVLVLAYVRRWGLKWPGRSGLPVVLGVMVALLILVSFYVPFVSHPSFQSTYETYSQKKVGLGPFNNLPAFVNVSIFYNSPYYMIVMCLLTLVGWTVALRQASRSKYLAYVLAGLCVIGLLAATAFPSAFVIGGKSVVVLFFVPPVVALVFSSTIERKLQLVVVWFFAFFISKAFCERAPGLHYYGFSPAWATIAAVGLEHVLQWLEDNVARYVSPRGGPATPKLWRHAGTMLLLAGFGLLAYYHYMLFVRHDEEYALNFPDSKHALYWTPQERRPDMPFFGLPHRAGWKTLASLYADGILRGDYETNGRLPRPMWYVQPLPKLTGIPRYFFFDEESALLKPIAKFSKDAIEHFHELVGEVLVDGKPRLLIYEDRRAIPGPVSIQQYRSEDYEQGYDRRFDLGTLKLLSRYGPTAPANFRDLANYLQAAAGEEDAIVFSSREQPLILSYHYQGKADYLPLQPSDTLTGTPDAAKHPAAYVLWHHPEDGAVQSVMSDQLDEYGEFLGAHTFGETAVFVYRSRMTIDEDELTRRMSEATIGDKVALLEYRLDGATLSPGDSLGVTLLWQALRPMSEDYTVFVHLVRYEPGGEIACQVDSQPAAGAQPTSGWVPGQVVTDYYLLELPLDMPAGEYQPRVGMYDLETMKRLPVSAPAETGAYDEITLFPNIVVRRSSVE